MVLSKDNLCVTFQYSLLHNGGMERYILLLATTSAFIMSVPGYAPGIYLLRIYEPEVLCFDH